MASDVHQSLAECRGYLKQRLDDCFTRRDHLDPSKRFARNGVTREIFDEQSLFHLLKLIIYQGYDGTNATDEDVLRSLVFEIRGSETDNSPGYCNILATLLYARCTDDCLKTWAKSLLRQRNHDCEQRLVYDTDLPLTEPAARATFGHEDGHSFWEQQSLFCPVTLKVFDESVYVGRNQSCPLPFMEEPVKIGKGAFAIVYKVKIEKGHMVNQSSGWALQSSKWYAQKRYIDYNAEAKKAFEAEDSTIKKFIQAAKSHENILVTRASLEWGTTYSLFFDLAKYSLWDYFEDPEVAISTLEQKKAVFSRTIGLAGALAYLHDELFLASTGEQLCCYHLDLKPHNILVFEEGGNIIWKVSDFGISQIKRIPASRARVESEHHVSFLNKIFRPDMSSTDPSSGVENPRDAGTYTAPEARHKTEKITRTSDVWSLGCVLTLVLTFLENQRTGIEEFKDARSKDRQDDLFYDSFPPLFGTEPRPSLRVSVRVWLEHLTENAKKRSEAEGEAVALASDLIQHRMLLPTPSDRVAAKIVEQELRSIQTCFAISATPFQIPLEQRQPLTERPHSSPCRLDKWKNMIYGHRSASVKASDTWHFKLPESTRGCKFSHDGKYLGIEGSKTITTLGISEIQQHSAGRNHPPPKQEQWSDLSLGSRYLCAAVASPYFKCYYAPLSSTDPLPKRTVDTRVESRIRKIVLSPNDEITAFVVEEPRQGKTMLKIGLYRTEDMLRVSPEQGEPRSTRHDSSSTTRPLTARALREELPWENIITNPKDCDLPTTAHIHHLKFSNDSKILMALSKPYKWEPTQKYHYDIFTWDVTSGRRILSYTNKIEGFYDMEYSWRILAIALFTNQPSFAAVSSKKIRIGSYEWGGYEAHSQPTGDEFLDVVVGEEGDELVLIGRSNSRGKIKAFRLQSGKVRSLESVGKGVDTGIGDYNPLTDSCCLFKELGYGKQGMLIAKVKGREMEGKLSVCYLD